MGVTGGLDRGYSDSMTPSSHADRRARLAQRLCGALDRYAARFVASGRVEPGFKPWTPIGDDTFELVLVGFDADVAFLLRASAED